MTTVTVSLVLLVSLAALITFNSELTAGYTLQKGETVFGIVERHEETVETILAVDLDVPDAYSTIPTEKILISDPSHNIDTLQGCRDVYTMQPGDTLFDVARRYGVTVQGILDVNPNDPEPDVYNPGLKINIPPCTAYFDRLKACADVYTVKPGDSLYNIAQQYGTTVQAILAANPDITNPDLIFPGQQINIPPCNGDEEIKWVV